MKFIILTLSLFILVSCKNSDTNSGMTTETISEESESKYVLPTIGLYRSFNMNFQLEWSYEIISINPTRNGNVLGSSPFLIDMNGSNELEMRFYSDYYLKSVRYMNISSGFPASQLTNLDKSILSNPGLKKIDNFVEEFTFGRENFASPEQDIKNKVVFIEVQKSDRPYLSTSHMMFWLSCDNGFKQNKCDDGKLRFNYKLLDYSLQIEK